MDKQAYLAQIDRVIDAGDGWGPHGQKIGLFNDDVGVFRQRRRVHVRVDARRYAECLLKRTQQRIVNPIRLGRLGD